MDSSDRLVAIKLEKINPPPKFALLEFESKIYNYIYDKSYPKYNGIPKVYWNGIKDDYYVLVIEALGPNLDNLHKMGSISYNPNGKRVNTFSLKTTLLIAQDLMKTIFYIHSKGVIHRDIKPENFLIGLNNNRIHTIDFGLSKLYRQKDRNHVQFKESGKLIGNIRYCSINCHKGYELSRRDDLESIGYILIYFLKGYLPWQGLPKDNVSERTKEIKESITNNELCSQLPNEFKTYMDIVKSLEFTEKPDYNKLLSLFTSLYNKMNYEYDDIYDWSK